jgi:hypothetical protein
MTTALEGVRGQRHAPAVLYPGKDPVPIVQLAGWTPGPLWTGAENLTATGIRSPDRPARSQSLYQLRYPAHSQTLTTGENHPYLMFIIFRLLITRQFTQSIKLGFKFQLPDHDERTSD